MIFDGNRDMVHENGTERRKWARTWDFMIIGLMTEKWEA
jgi:hypothetical protein